MGFVAQRLADGRWIRVLTAVDQYTRTVNHGRELVATGALVSGSILCSIARTVHQQGLFEPDQLNGLGSALILNR